MGENGSTCVAKSAQDLLVDFQQTGRQEPFEEIARRYAGMVYNVALRVTHDGHDAEDATQATFLTLAVHAKTAGKIRFVGPWLKKVSHRLALDIRRSKKRRTTREQRHVEGNSHANGDGNGFEVPASEHMQVDELRHILREEIDKLPSKYRLPLILYYFGGLSPEEMSKELQCNTSTLGVRLHRGRKMLADSLTHRGINMNSAVVAAVLSGTIDNFVRDSLVHACSHAVVHVGASGHVADAVVSNHIVSLMRTATAALRWARLKAAVAVIALAVSTLAGASEVLSQYDIVSMPSLKMLNPLRLIRPLMDRMFRTRRISVQANSPVPAASDAVATESSTDFFAVPAYSDFALAQPWNMQTMGLATLPQIFDRASSATASVESIHSMASQYILPPAAASIALPPVTTQKYTPTVPLAPMETFALATVPAVTTSGIVVDRSIGNTGAPDGQLVISSGHLDAPRFIVGDSSTGQLTVNGGKITTPEFTIGRQRGSSGRVEINDGELIASNIIVGDGGNGELVQNGGHVVASGDKPGTLTLGAQKGSTGAYAVNNGTLFSDTVVVGALGDGSLRLNGGTTSVSVAQVGLGSTGQGTLSVLDGHLETVTPSDPSLVASFLTSATESPAAPPSAVINVGSSGNGTFLITGGSSSNPSVQERPGTYGTDLIIRSTNQGAGTLRGYGQLALTGEVTQNGRVIGDGFGQHRALDLSTASRITNSIENPTKGGANGWYAVNRGSIKLPRIRVTSSEYSYTWGEETHDDTLDLVNSVRSRAGVGGMTGFVDISLLDPSTDEVPALPGGRDAVGLWSLDSSVDLTDISLMIRYDDALASQMHLSEQGLRLWVFENNSWQVLTGDASGIDTTNKLIWGSAAGDPTYFAAAPLGLAGHPVTQLIPEPSTLAMALAGAGSLLLRRRRHDRHAH